MPHCEQTSTALAGLVTRSKIARVRVRMGAGRVQDVSRPALSIAHGLGEAPPQQNEAARISGGQHGARPAGRAVDNCSELGSGFSHVP